MIWRGVLEPARDREFVVAGSIYAEISAGRSERLHSSARPLLEPVCAYRVAETPCAGRGQTAYEELDLREAAGCESWASDLPRPEVQRPTQTPLFPPLMLMDCSPASIDHTWATISERPRSRTKPFQGNARQLHANWRGHRVTCCGEVRGARGLRVFAG